MTREAAGIVVIGRNEGLRLVRCLESLVPTGLRIVYVDSASSDGSADAARRLGIEVVEVDPSTPMSAARSRNEGFARLAALAPDTAYVQFVDGDCELVEGWLDAAVRTLDETADVAVVCGLLRERESDSTIYSRLCAMEWAGEIGDVGACGGVAMMRASVFRQTGGFRTDSIGGEEPELCYRMRGLGWRIVRIDRPMALHEAAITRFGQWWRRAVRGGYALADGVALHGRGPERYNSRELASAVVWGGLGPPALVASLVAAVWTPWALVAAGVVVAAYAALYLRIRRARSSSGPSDARLYATFCVLGKVPQVCGALLRLRDTLRGRRGAWIEYKRP